MQFYDVNPDTGSRASVMTTPNDVVFSIPVSLANQAGLQKDGFVRLRYGMDGDKKAIQITPAQEATAWKVRGRKAVVQIYAKQLRPNADFPKTSLSHELGEGDCLILDLPPTWEIKPDAIDQRSGQAGGARRKGK